MTKTIARFLIAGAAASAIVLPAAPASACSATIQECVDRVLSSIAISEICIPMGHTPPLCLSGSTTG